MFLASILTLGLNLAAAPNTLHLADIASLVQKDQAMAHKSASLVTLAQNAGPPKSPPPSSPSASPVQSQNGTQSSPPSAQTKKTATPSSAHKRRKHRKPTSRPQNVVVKNGSTTDPSVQFSTTASPEQATRDRQKTAGLLATTQANLQKLSGRQLSTSQQDTLTEIHSYMQQAKAAEDAGDLQSAQNLALKAQLLSADLVRK